MHKQEIFDLIKTKVDKIEAGGELPKQIANVYGIVGIGKTHLIRQIFDTFKQDYTVILLNFDLTEQQDHPEQIYSWNNVLETLRSVSPLQHLPDQITFANGSKHAASDVHVICDVASEQVNADTSEQKKPLLLLLDNLDELLYWKWVQEYIIKPLLDQQQQHTEEAPYPKREQEIESQQHALVVATSQSPLFWHFWELREQCKLLQLDALSLEETRAFLKDFGTEMQAESLHEVTGGYPMALKRLIRLIGNNGNAATYASNPAFLDTYRQDVRKRLMEYLPERVQQDLEQYEILQAIAALGPEFNLASLRRQINERKMSDQRLPPGRLNNTITSLNSRGFFSYNAIQHTYTLHPLIRSLV